MHSTHKEGKSVFAERFISTLKNKIDKYMTSIPKIVYIDKLDDIVNKCNNTDYRTIKMKPVDVKSNTYINFVPNWSEEVFVIKKAENTVPWTYVTLLVILTEKKLWERFTKMNCKKQTKKSSELKK